MMKRKTLCRAVALVLALLFSAVLFVGCKAQKTLMSLGEQCVSVNEYELLLSRMKGTLAYSEYPVDQAAFWNEIVSVNGQTYNDFFCARILEEAKRMLVKIYLFEEVYGLTLPQSSYNEIDGWIRDIISFEFGGSKAQFNSALSAYGINADILRENYVAEEKIEQLLSYISSITTDTAREEYYTENYVCFRQILFPLYAYQYETDENGDDIYFHEGTSQIYYDVSASTRKDADGNLILDANGDVVYFTEDGRISYNTQKGVRVGKDADNDGHVDYVEYDDETCQAVLDRANHLSGLIETGDFALFEEYGAIWSQDDIWSDYPNGVFLSLEKEYGVAYIADIQTALAQMEVGQISLVSSDQAYHIIMKYELPVQGYKDSANSDWFETFEQEMAQSIVDSMCEKYLADVRVDHNVLAVAMDMKSVGANISY